MAESVQQEIDRWKRRIKQGEEFRKRTSYEEDWAEWRKYYRNEWRKGILPVNLVFPLIRSIVPRVYFRDPQVVVTPRKEGMGLQAKVVESIDNWLVKKIRVKYAFKAMIQDACLYGTGIGKGGYDSEFGWSPEHPREKDALTQYLIENELWDEEINQLEYNENIMPGMPWYLRVDPRDFIVPLGCNDLRAASWVAHRIIRPVDDVREDKRYENNKGLKGTHTLQVLREKEKLDLGITEPEDSEYVVLWEIYDVKSKTIKVITDSSSKFLRNEPDPLQVGGIPFDSLVFNQDTEFFWGISDVKYLEPQQLEINEVRSQFQKLRQASILQFIVQRGAFTEEDLEKLRSGEPHQFIEVNLQNLREAIFQFQPYPNDFLLMAGNTIRQDMRETVGFSRNQLGEFDQSTRRTATEASIVNEAAMLRVDERRDLAADVYVEVIRRINKFIFQNWSEARIAQVVGPDGVSHWTRYTGEQIRGDYDIQVDPDASKPMTSAARKQDAMELLKIITQIPPQFMIDPVTQMPVVNFVEVVKYVVEQFDSIDPWRVVVHAQAPETAGNVTDISTLSQQLSGGGQRNAGVPVQLLQMLQGMGGAPQGRGPGQ